MTPRPGTPGQRADALVGRERTPSRALERIAERLGREEVAAGAAGREEDERSAVILRPRGGGPASRRAGGGA